MTSILFQEWTFVKGSFPLAWFILGKCSFTCKVFHHWNYGMSFVNRCMDCSRKSAWLSASFVPIIWKWISRISMNPWFKQILKISLIGLPFILHFGIELWSQPQKVEIAIQPKFAQHSSIALSDNVSSIAKGLHEKQSNSSSNVLLHANPPTVPTWTVTPP